MSGYSKHCSLERSKTFGFQFLPFSADDAMIAELKFVGKWKFQFSSTITLSTITKINVKFEFFQKSWGVFL